MKKLAIIVLALAGFAMAEDHCCLQEVWTGICRIAYFIIGFTVLVLPMGWLHVLIEDKNPDVYQWLKKNEMKIGLVVIPISLCVIMGILYYRIH